MVKNSMHYFPSVILTSHLKKIIIQSREVCKMIRLKVRKVVTENNKDTKMGAG